MGTCEVKGATTSLVEHGEEPCAQSEALWNEKVICYD
jgi:hypothetical protein